MRLALLEVAAQGVPAVATKALDLAIRGELKLLMGPLVDAVPVGRVVMVAVLQSLRWRSD
jgi:hypothetical protein